MAIGDVGREETVHLYVLQSQRRPGSSARSYIKKHNSTYRDTCEISSQQCLTPSIGYHSDGNITFRARRSMNDCSSRTLTSIATENKKYASVREI